LQVSGWISCSLPKDSFRLHGTASGDPRNIVKTLADLPRSYSGTLQVTLDDQDPRIVARKVIMCILAASVTNADKASECITHIWYSAFVRQTDLELLTAHVLPSVQQACSKIKDNSFVSLHTETWQIGNRSLRLGLTKKAW
jgi:hypothetical protein